MQRNQKNAVDLSCCFLESRVTFTDVHHLLRCWCQTKRESQPTRLSNDYRTRSLVARATWCIIHISNIVEAGGARDSAEESYARCRLMEFRVPALRHMVYERLPEPVRKELHVHIAEIYEKETRQCASCGGAPYLKIPGKKSLVSFRRLECSAERAHSALGCKPGGGHPGRGYRKRAPEYLGSVPFPVHFLFFYDGWLIGLARSLRRIR